MFDVLVVDDNQDIAESVEALLLLDGYRVRVAPDGEAGLSALLERLPDVLVLDVEMPVLGCPGMACRMLIEDCGHEDIPIVLVSGAARLPEIAARIGTPYYLAKPCGPTDLLALVARAAKDRIAPSPPRAADTSRSNRL